MARRPLRAIWACLLAVLLCAGAASGQDAADPGSEAKDEEAAATGPEPAPADASESEAPDSSAKPPPAAFDSGVEVIRVTGQRRQDLLLDVSSSVSAFDTSELRQLRVQNLEDLSEFTPNLEVNTRAASNPTLFIRGIGLKDYNANSTGAVAIYQDGIPINSPVAQLFQLFDIESVEVLRGPQGSLYGRNATAGAILLKSTQPDGDWSTTANISYGNYNSIDAEGAIAFPLIEDVLAARLSFMTSFRDGFVSNECADWDPEAHGAVSFTEANARAAWDARGQPKTPLRFMQPGNVDNQCILNKPGFIVTQSGASAGLGQVGEWVPTAANVVTVEDLQGLDHELNDVGYWAARGILRLQPKEGMDWQLNFHGGQNRAGSRHLQPVESKPGVDGGDPAFGNFKNFIVSNNLAGFAERNWESRTRVVDGLVDTPNNPTPGTAGGDVFHGFYNSDGDENIDLWGTGLVGSWELDSVLLQSFTGYDWNDRLVEDEGDASPAILAAADLRDSAWQVSQELRATGETGRLNWVVGGFFLHEEIDAHNFYPSANGFAWDQVFTQGLWAWAPYVQTRHDFTEELNLQTGIRYNWERKNFALDSTVLSNGGSERTDLSGEELGTWSSVTGDATFTYAPLWQWLDAVDNDSLNLYAKYSHATKAGHFNASLVTEPGREPSQSLKPVEPESIHAAEIGWKSSWLQDRLQLSVAGFRYWYQDLQVFDIVNEAGRIPTVQLLNSDARVWGAEADLQLRPVEGLFIQAGLGWLDTEFVDFVISKQTQPPGIGGTGGKSELFDYSGNPLISAPALSFSGLVDWELPIGRWGTLIPHFDWSYSSRIYFDASATELLSQAPLWVLGAGLSYRTPDGRIEIGGWVANLTNQIYVSDAFDLTQNYRTILQVWADPRTYGLTVSYHW